MWIPGISPHPNGRGMLGTCLASYDVHVSNVMCKCRYKSVACSWFDPGFGGQNPRFVHTFCDEDYMSVLKRWRKRSCNAHQVPWNRICSSLQAYWIPTPKKLIDRRCWGLAGSMLSRSNGDWGRLRTAIVKRLMEKCAGYVLSHTWSLQVKHGLHFGTKFNLVLHKALSLTWSLEP